MISKKTSEPAKKFSTWLKIGISFITIVYLIILTMIGIAISIYISMQTSEKRLVDKFNKEIANVPEMKMVNFNSHGKYSDEADIRVEIKNKGVVWFDYTNKSGITSISEIEGRYTVWNCFSNNPDEKREIYNGSRPLYLGKDSDFKKWFPFEVNSLQDLIDKYDEIIKILNTFPKREHTFGQAAIKNPDPNYILYTKWSTDVGSGESTCDLFQ